MRVRCILLAGVFILCQASCLAQSAGGAHLGALYPAGGQQGSTFQILASGQSLKGAQGVLISGQGVRASVKKTYRPFTKLKGDERREIARLLATHGEARWAELYKQGQVKTQRPPLKEWIGVKNLGLKKAPDERVVLPEHPLLDQLESKSFKDLLFVALCLMDEKKRQPNAQIAESALVEISIDKDALPGDRAFRIRTSSGLTNPMLFQVGSLPETREQEPNDPGDRFEGLPEEPTWDTPVLLNGQILPGDVDRFRIRGRKGQKLTIEAHARALNPFLADAVPGWFQATVAVVDAKGNELAYEDDYRFNPDPVLFCEIPEDGEYELEIRDSIYRGREDFIYRVAVSERPFITQAFPLGGQEGVEISAAVSGWNMPESNLPLDTQPGSSRIRKTEFKRGDWVSNPLLYAVDALPEKDEREPNNKRKKAQELDLPLIMNGRIHGPGDIDHFRFKGKAGQEVVAEVTARRLLSPLDSVLRLMDSSGHVIGWNDDAEDKQGTLHRDMGCLTHPADSFLTAKLPDDGDYVVQVTDAQDEGGASYAYRLRISEPRPDYELFVVPSTLSVKPGQFAPVCVHALRREGLGEEIRLSLKDAPKGVSLQGGRIPAGQDRILMTLSAEKPVDRPMALKIEGRAWVQGHEVLREAVPAEDLMQAFLYQHLVPSQDLLLNVFNTKPGPAIQLADAIPVVIPKAGSVRVGVKTQFQKGLEGVELALKDPPKGISLLDVTVQSDGLTFSLKADERDVSAGLEGNLIVEAFADVAAKNQGKKAAQKKRTCVGVLPAIPFKIGM